MKSATFIVKNFVLVGMVALSAMAAACSPMTATQGNLVEDYRLSEIKPGVQTRTDVMKILGSPTTVAPFDDKVWYYMGQKTAKRGILDPKVTDERVIVVTFSEDGVVETVQDKTGGREDVPLAEETTPTHGNDLTVMQQFLGNLGKFNPQSEQK